MITFGSDKRFGLVDAQRKDLQGNRAVGGECEARGGCHHHETWIFFQCPQYSSTKNITDIALEMLQSAVCPFLITTPWEKWMLNKHCGKVQTGLIWVRAGE